MNNATFLQTINNSFQVYLKTGSRSNRKLEVLHGAIAKALSEKLGNGYIIESLGFGAGGEAKIKGRYGDKNVDIGIFKNGRALAAIGVKFVMSNYSQNSNNYFENMLGETANLRGAGVPYFQILVLTQNAPYFNSQGEISKFEKLTPNNLHKYERLSHDDPQQNLHSPDKVLMYIVKMTADNAHLRGKNRQQYATELTDNTEFSLHEVEGITFGENTILNNFETYLDAVVSHISS